MPFGWGQTKVAITFGCPHLTFYAGCATLLTVRLGQRESMTGRMSGALQLQHSAHLTEHFGVSIFTQFGIQVLLQI